MSHRNLFAKLLILAVLCLSSFAGAQVPWHLNYENGLEALRSRNYQRAVESLRMALEINRAPAARVKLYGTRYIPYYPWFHLGKAFYELAESDEDKAAEYYEESVTAFDVSIEYGEIKKDLLQRLLAYFGEMRERRGGSSSIATSSKCSSTSGSKDATSARPSQWRSRSRRPPQWRQRRALPGKLTWQRLQ